MPEPNAELAQAMRNTKSPNDTGEDLTTRELADLVRAWLRHHRNINAPVYERYVCKLLRGEIRWPNDDYRAAFRAVLGASTDSALGFRRTRRSGRSVNTVAEVNRKQFLKCAAAVAVLPAAAATPIPVELADLAVSARPAPLPDCVSEKDISGVRKLAKVYGSLDHEGSGSLIRDALNAQLTSSLGLLFVKCPDRLKAELYEAVGFLAHTAAFNAFDSYEFDDARDRFKIAQACAEVEGYWNWHLRAKVLSSRARLEIWCNDPDEGLTLTELALVRARDRLTARERAMLHSARARALAKLGRVEETMAAIGMADTEFSHADPRVDPPWMAYYDRAQHDGDTGHALWDLGVNGTFAEQARRRLADAVAGHSDAFARSRAISGIKLASLVAVTGDPAEAVSLGFRALDDFSAVRSRRASNDLLELSAFVRPHLAINGVAELRTRVNGMLALQ
ncbi:hypothetical protein C8D87_114174 [Lentzea atacamensis]|uniref:Uncharacterized protein n=1 Tax=Lentzea atacamensis TaxID=531938 RepID=A0ABX9DWM5_9PSEU|nr:XRE family transcriptional regulator [Lentzea atacamensis]RAS59562.1 hypothetical protein C8D87_114174 [Lentzea atacamensis]